MELEHLIRRGYLSRINEDRKGITPISLNNQVSQNPFVVKSNLKGTNLVQTQSTIQVKSQLENQQPLTTTDLKAPTPTKQTNQPASHAERPGYLVKMRISFLD